MPAASGSRLADAFGLSRSRSYRTSRPDGAIVHRPDDFSALHRMEHDYDSRCCWCYVAAPHSVAAHLENLGPGAGEL